MKEKFKIKIKKLIYWKYFSSFQSISSGNGIEKSEFRKYSPWDSMKSINWKISAKHGQLYTNLFQEEKEINLDVFLDINYNWKTNLALVSDLFEEMISYSQKNWVFLSIYYPIWEKIQNLFVWKDFLKAHKFMQEMWKIIKKTNREYQSWIVYFLHEMRKIKKRRGIVIISDFLDLDDEIKKIIDYLALENSVYLFKLPVNLMQWQNYNNFFMDWKNDTSKLHFINL